MGGGAGFGSRTAVGGPFCSISVSSPRSPSWSVAPLLGRGRLLAAVEGGGKVSNMLSGRLVVGDRGVSCSTYLWSSMSLSFEFMRACGPPLSVWAVSYLVPPDDSSGVRSSGEGESVRCGSRRGSLFFQLSPSSSASSCTGSERSGARVEGAVEGGDWLTTGWALTSAWWEETVFLLTRVGGS